MPSAHDSNLLQVLLDFWDRNNRTLINLLRAVPPGGLQAKAIPTSPSVARMFMHMHYVRLVFLAENLPDLHIDVPTNEWFDQADPDRIAEALAGSAQTVRNAVESCVLSGRAMERDFDHPVIFLEHIIWHEGYHHGQIKLALKLAGLALDDERIGPLTWDLFIDKTKKA